MKKEKIESVLNKIVQAEHIEEKRYEGTRRGWDFVSFGYPVGDKLYIPLNHTAVRVELEKFDMLFRASLINNKNGVLDSYVCLRRHANTNICICDIDKDGNVLWNQDTLPGPDFYKAVKHELNKFIRSFDL